MFEYLLGMWYHCFRGIFMAIYEVLNILESHGFEVYIVGGYVRDRFLNRDSVDVDIITNALPSEVALIFCDNLINIFEKYGAVKIKLNGKIIDITTYRRELSYSFGKPNDIVFISDIKEDLIRRDFTINTLCMDKNNNIIDYLNIIDDFKLRVIKTTRETTQVLSEDSSRMLRALRFMSELGFSLDNKIQTYILENKKDFLKIPYSKRKKELDKLFNSGSSYQFFRYIKEYDLEQYLGIYVNDFREVKSSIGVWAQLEMDEHYIFSKYEKEQISSVKYLLNKGTIEKYDLYKYGLDLCLIVANILCIDYEKINLLYTNIKIKCIMDVDITGNEICSILNIKPSKLVGNYLSKIEREIVNGNLNNNYEEIVKKLKEWGE